MLPLFTEQQFNAAKYADMLSLRCNKCKKEFNRTKHHIALGRKGLKHFKCLYCSVVCAHAASNKSRSVKCKQCSVVFTKLRCQIQKSPNHFCSKSCSAIYRNAHKTKGTQRSKLEVWIESKLRELYPGLVIFFNKKDVIKAELDIHIPSLKLAFELNGVFHYEPIFGHWKMYSIQDNDKRKFQACIEHDIELCIIDTSQQKYVKPKTSQKYLDIITDIINAKLKQFNQVNG